MVKENDKEKLEIMNPDAAGIDIGSREHYVCLRHEVVAGSCFSSVKYEAISIT
jgi:hypothetical protein